MVIFDFDSNFNPLVKTQLRSEHKELTVKNIDSHFRNSVQTNIDQNIIGKFPWKFSYFQILEILETFFIRLTQSRYNYPIQPVGEKIFFILDTGTSNFHAKPFNLCFETLIHSWASDFCLLTPRWYQKCVWKLTTTLSFEDLILIFVT